MSTEVATTQSFQERMFERIRDQMGDLMTEAELKALVEKAMEKAFFEPPVTVDRWGGRTFADESTFMKMLRLEMQGKVTAALKEWIAANPEAVAKAINDALAKGMLGLIGCHIENVMSMPLSMLRTEVLSKLTT